MEPTREDCWGELMSALVGARRSRCWDLSKKSQLSHLQSTNATVASLGYSVSPCSKSLFQQVGRQLSIAISKVHQVQRKLCFFLGLQLGIPAIPGS